jgi:hypothetical protein
MEVPIGQNTGCPYDAATELGRLVEQLDYIEHRCNVILKDRMPIVLH